MYTLTNLRRWRRAAPFAALLGLAGCDIIEFSPNDHRVPKEFTNLTEKNLAKLQARPLAPGDSLLLTYAAHYQGRRSARRTDGAQAQHFGLSNR